MNYGSYFDLSIKSFISRKIFLNYMICDETQSSTLILLNFGNDFSKLEFVMNQEPIRSKVALVVVAFVRSDCVY